LSLIAGERLNHPLETLRLQCRSRTQEKPKLVCTVDRTSLGFLRLLPHAQATGTYTLMGLSGIGWLTPTKFSV
jgi:hypothetical protein